MAGFSGINISIVLLMSPSFASSTITSVSLSSIGNITQSCSILRCCSSAAALALVLGRRSRGSRDVTTPIERRRRIVAAGALKCTRQRIVQDSPAGFGLC